MISLKCKSCGEIIPVAGNQDSVICPSCGNIYEVPLDEKKEQYLNLYSRADDAWDHKDFEEASDLYQQILNSDNTQAEAHFGLVLCKYGITYEIDPITQKKMPTCNRINRDSILDDKHFLSAMKYASKEAAASFQKRAQEIDRISRDFLKIVDKEPPYDVFVSYKRTAEDGSATKDSKVARKLYFHLKEKGFKVFFAEETLKSVAGEKYEPYIFAALSSAPVMVLVGSKREYFEATWVKNEWRRYLALMNQGLKKTLIPAYFEMDPYHMPGELRNLQAMNAADLTFMEDITEIIRKKVADAKDDTPSTEVKGQSLRDKYATKDKVKQLVGATDCDREFATNVLVQCHGDMKKSQQYIEDDPDYKKSLWICVECGAHNTHEKCHNCGTTKKESLEVGRARKEMEERERRKSAEYKRKKAESAKKVAKSLVAVAFVVAFALFSVLVIYPKMIRPNLNAESLYTPEIVQSYSGTYKTGRTEGNAVVTITSCDQSGKLAGVCEFIVGNDYGKYEITGQITQKKNNGKVTLTLTPGQWLIQPGDYSPLETMTVEITDNYQSFKCSLYYMYWKVGTNDEYYIKTVDDLQKLVNSEATYQLKNDIDLAGVDWKPIEGFSGTLMGNGFSIKNLTISSDSSNVGFFSELYGFVSNVKFENAKIIVSGNRENIGILAGKSSNASFTAITTNGSVVAERSNYVGGIVGYVYEHANKLSMADLENNSSVNGNDHVGGIFGYMCNDNTDYSSYTKETQLSEFTNSGKVKGNGNYIGGIIGECYFTMATYMTNFSNSGAVAGKNYVGGTVGRGSANNNHMYVTGFDNVGAISGGAYVGGLFGSISGNNGRYTKDRSYIKDSSNKSAISAEAVAGCIAGEASYVSIDSCKNEGSTLTASKYIVQDGAKLAYVGGYVGKGYCANDCINKVSINYSAGGAYVGGIIGYAYADIDQYTVSNLQNEARISGNDHVGGIFGYVCNKFDGLSYQYNGTQLSELKNSGNITGTGNYIGGIIGECYCKYTIYLIDLNNTANVSGNGIYGGVIGYCHSQNKNSYISGSSTTSGTLIGKIENITVQ